MIGDSDEALLLLDAATERVLAASRTAQALLSPASHSDPVGRQLSELTVATTSEASMLLASGRLNGYETRRLVRGSDSAEPLNLWLRAIDNGSEPPLMLAMVAPSAVVADSSVESVNRMSSTVIGATDPKLILDRISDNVESFLGVPPAEVLGQSLLQLVATEDVADLLFALGRAASTQEGVALSVRTPGPGTRDQRCQLVILPMAPAPSFAFALQPAADDLDSFRSSEDLQRLLSRLGEAIRAAGTARDLTESRVSQSTNTMASLTIRESQIVSRLLDGDRVPAIARQLFLAQSTVRNHLSAVFSKFGVRSQQELIVLLRQSQGGSADS